MAKSEIRNPKSETNPKSQIQNQKILTFRNKFEEAMDDDFNTPLALAALFELVTHANKLMQNKDKFSDDEKAELVSVKNTILALGGVFGIDLLRGIQDESISESEIKRLVDERNEARAAKDFKKADDARKKLASQGIILEDTKDGTVWRRNLA